ncbi:MAG: hypothetical protein QM831_32060 [Kofleriaceae bacterium]
MRENRKRPEGWRTIRVGELELWWTVGKPHVEARLSDGYQHITLSLVVERADGSGKKLKATIHAKRGIAIPAAGFRDVQSVAIEPATVRRLVELAAPKGAWPTGTGMWQTTLDLAQQPLPADTTFRPEHLEGLTVVWQK